MSTLVAAPAPIIEPPVMEVTKSKHKKHKDESSDSEVEEKHANGNNSDAESESSEDEKVESTKPKSKKNKSSSKQKAKKNESDEDTDDEKDDKKDKKDKSKKDKDGKKKGKGKGKSGKKKRKGAKKVKVSDQYLNAGFDIRVPPVDTHLRAFIHYISTTGPIREIERLKAENKPVTEENVTNVYHWSRIKEAREEWETHCTDIDLKLNPEKKEKRDTVPVRRRQTEKKQAKPTKSGKVKTELTPDQIKAKLKKKQAEIDDINGRDPYAKDIAILNRIRIRLNKSVPRYLTIFVDRLVARLTYNAYVNALGRGRGKITPEHALLNAKNNVPYFNILGGYRSVRFYEYRSELIAQALAAKKKSKKSDENVAPSVDPTELPPFAFEQSAGIPSVEDLIAQCKKPKKPKTDAPVDAEDAEEEDDEDEEEEEEEEHEDAGSGSDDDDEADSKKKTKKSKKSKKPVKPTLSFMTHTTQRCNSVKYELVELARKDNNSESATTSDKYSHINISNEYRMMCRNIILEVIWKVAQALIELTDCSDFRTVGVNHIKVLLSIMMCNGGVDNSEVTKFFTDANSCIDRLISYNKAKNVVKVKKREEKKKEKENGETKPDANDKSESKHEKKSKDKDSEPKEKKHKKKSKQ